MFEIKKNILEKDLKYDNETILKYHIEYPQIISNYKYPSITKFNLYNKNKALELQKKSETELFNDAKELYNYNKENGYPIMIYEIFLTYNITLNYNNIVSLYFDEYLYTGGAHGITTRTSQNWNMLKNNLINLYSLFPKNPYFILDILKEIILQISNNPEIYFNDACCLVINSFNPNSFYLTKNAIIIYFQQYDIAPYSSGIRTFEIKKII
ncbi:MAG: DUF3298 and DUF4163 domain-containing protein [Candidatus Scatovivens sp.]